MIEFGHGTHTGLRREHNEDTYCADPDMGLWLVADGMGGHEHGEVASALARDVVIREVHKGQALANAIQSADEEIIRHSNEKRSERPMGTTVVAAMVHDGRRAYIANVGDSRLYLARKDCAHALTEDHTLIAAQIKSGQLAREDAGRSPFKGVLTRALGQHESVQVDTLVVDLLPGDRLMLCSDGLWSSVADAQIAEFLGTRPISDAVPELAEQALRNAGPRSDNVTLLAVEFEGAEGSTAAPAVSTRALGDEVFASTIQASLTPGDANSDDLDEAEIERSIREINEAIRRSSQKKS